MLKSFDELTNEDKPQLIDNAMFLLAALAEMANRRKEAEAALGCPTSCSIANERVRKRLHRERDSERLAAKFGVTLS